MDFDKLRFIRKLVLIAIFSDDDLMDTFVVKGGSAIDLIYKLDARASVDIDLSIGCVKKSLYLGSSMIIY